MAEYKDAQVVITEITKVCDDCWHVQRIGGCPGDCFIKYAVKAVESVPAADAVPVVRCRDCRHFCKHDESVGFCKGSHCLKRTNGYCDDGVQKSRHDNAE